MSFDRLSEGSESDSFNTRMSDRTNGLGLFASVRGEPVEPWTRQAFYYHGLPVIAVFQERHSPVMLPRSSTSRALGEPGRPGNVTMVPAIG